MSGVQKVKYKTRKLLKLEKNRYSILTNDLEHCFLCNQASVDIHEIFGGSNRRISMEDGFCVPLCRHHHRLATDFIPLQRMLKMACQKKCEETMSREEFIKRVGRNYL